jgi:hypothetical protein
LVRDYTGLYTKDTFDQWARIFGPGFTSARQCDRRRPRSKPHPVSRRAAAGILARQGDAGRLSNVRIEQRDRLASIWADFDFHYDGAPSKENWSCSPSRIHSAGSSIR